MTYNLNLVGAKVLKPVLPACIRFDENRHGSQVVEKPFFSLKMQENLLAGLRYKIIFAVL
jgi:hypothetical protein